VNTPQRWNTPLENTVKEIKYQNSADICANSVFSTRSLYVFSNRNSGSAMKSATRVGNTEEARVFRENFYGGKNDFLLWFKFFNA
jgi:hypothetical protein